MAEHACFQRLEIDGHIGKFRHDPFIIGRVRTFRILFAGWLLGGGLIVLLSVLQPRATALPRSDGKSVSAPAAVAPVSFTAESTALPNDIAMPIPIPIEVASIPGGVIVPVAGIRTDQLSDNYLQARGGGTRLHGAIDIMAPRNTPVLAAVDGTVRKLFTSAGGGLTIYQYDQDEKLIYYYAHLDRYAPTLPKASSSGRGASSASSARPATPRPTRRICTSPSRSFRRRRNGGRARP